jgi:pimeloyl-ACP methyl ester carboxylesterase
MKDRHNDPYRRIHTDERGTNPMTTQLTTTAAQYRSAPANGIDIHYIEAGRGEPLVLLHGGMVSTNPIWAPTPVSYSAHMERLAEGFRVIAPDTRGCGQTRHSDGTVTFDLLADDVLALIDALSLDRPLIAGFSEGATTATIVGIRRPDSVRAIVNDAGYDFFNPGARSFTIMRQILGGSPQATDADPDAAAAGFAQSPEMQAMFELLKADQDGAQGDGHWREYLRSAFHRTTRSPGYTFEDLGEIAVPTLILVGDRDQFCTAEEAVTAYRALKHGELGVLPATGHNITPAAIDTTINFFEQHR